VGALGAGVNQYLVVADAGRDARHLEQAQSLMGLFGYGLPAMGCGKTAQSLRPLVSFSGQSLQPRAQ
jgi:hypothetical protein